MAQEEGERLQANEPREGIDSVVRQLGDVYRVPSSPRKGPE